MVSNTNINFKKLSNKGYQNSDIQRIQEIADDVDNNSKDLNLLVNGYGDGKSTSIESMLDVGDIFSMGNYDQILEKMMDCKTDHEFLGIDEKYQLLVGQLKWLGFKWVKENGESTLEKDDDRLFQDFKPWIYDRQTDSLQKFDLESERKKPYIWTIKQQIEKYGIKSTLDFHKDKPIVEAYGLHLHPKTREKTISFTPIDMLDLIKEMDQTGDLVIDEGIGGEVTEVGSLDNYADTIQKITGKQVNNRTSKPKCDIPKIDNTDLKTDITDLWKQTREVYIDLYDALEQREPDREKGNLVYCDLFELVEPQKVRTLRMLLEKVREENSRKIPKVKEEKLSSIKIDKIVRINNLLKLADLIKKTSLNPAKVEAYRDKHNSVTRVRVSYPKYYDIISYSDKAYNVYLLNASADRDLPEWYSNLHTHFSPEVKILGKESGIETINENELVTEYVQFDYGKNSTISKGNLSSEKFQNVICKFIDWLDGDNFVTSVKSDRNGKYIPDLFDTESTNYAKIEGSNKARNCDNLFVIGSNRLADDKMWHTVKNRYQEIIEFTDKEWYKLKKIEKKYVEGVQQYGSQIGWKDPEEVFDDFEWERDYDFNPLQKIWNQKVDRHKFEKQNRKRFQDKQMGEGYVVTMGLRPKIGDRKFGKNKGDEGDLIKWITNQKKGTPLQKANWIKENIDSKYGFVELNLPDNIPLKTVYPENKPEWKIDYRGVIEEELQKKSWTKDPYTGEETREEVELYESVEEMFGKEIEELPFTKETLRNWVKDSVYLEYIPGSGRHSPPEVNATDISQSPWNNIPDSPF